MAIDPLIELGAGDDYLLSPGFSQWPSRHSQIPSLIEVKEDNLVWGSSDGDYGWHYPTAVSHQEILDSFVQIQNAGDVKKFARRFGVLELCEHGLPATHSPSPLWITGPHRFIPGWNMELAPQEKWPYCVATRNESLTQWLAIAQYLKEILLAVLTVRNDEDEDDIKHVVTKALNIRHNIVTHLEEDPWSLLTSLMPRKMEELTGKQTIIGFGKKLCAYMISELLQWGGVTTSLVWSNSEESRLSFNNGLSGALALDLAAVSSKAHSVANCTICNRPYLPSRKPQEGRRNYCGQEGCRRTGNALNQRSFRQRQNSEP